MVSRRQVIAGAVLLSSTHETSTADNRQSGVRTEFAFEAQVQVGAPLVIGSSARGLRRVVPIEGGRFEGPRISGRVLPGGADWQVVRADGVLDIEAKYTLEVDDDGALIMVTNKGVRHGPKEIIDKLAQGVDVDPAQYYFRTCAQFEAPSDGKHAWLNRAVFIGLAERKSRMAIIRFHEVL